MQSYSWKKIRHFVRDAIQGTDEDLTKISLNRAMVLLSIPMILEMVMESLFAVVDAFFVSTISVNAVATVGLTESVIFLIYALSIGLSNAATAMVARRVGEGKADQAAVAAAQAIRLGLIMSIAIGILGYWQAENILRLMGGDETLVASGAGYTRIMFGFNVVIMLLFLLNAIFRGVGNAALAMRTLWLANGINIILDPCLIKGYLFFPEMGIEGAAVATNIGRGVGVAFQLYLLFFGKGVIRLKLSDFRYHAKLVWRLIRVGAGGAGQYIISTASWIFLMRIVSTFGSPIVAGYTIAIRLIIFAILPAWGLANAAATLVGQNLGANRPERAEQAAWRASFYAMLFLLGISIICYIFAPELIGIFASNLSESGMLIDGKLTTFNPDDIPLMQEAGITSLRIICAGYLFFGYGMVLSQSLNGAGDTYTPTLINFVVFWLWQIPIAYLLAMPLGFEELGVFWTILVTEALFASVCILIFRRGKWKLSKI